MCHPYLGWVFLAPLNFLEKTLVNPPRGKPPRGFQIQAALTIEMKQNRCSGFCLFEGVLTWVTFQNWGCNSGSTPSFSSLIFASGSCCISDQS